MRRTHKTHLLKRMALKLSSKPYQGKTQFLVSVSGGVDSMVLLDVLIRLKQVHGASIGAIYFDHHSGDFSRLSREVVQSFCDAHDVPLNVIDVEMREGNFEFNASRYRHESLLSLCGIDDVIFMAHHRQDLMETVMLSMLRGKGVPSSLGFGEVSGRILRPFWDLDRSLIFKHARAVGVPHLIDPTNLDPNQFRGSMRRMRMTAAFRAHGGGDAGAAQWATSYEGIRKPLENEASSLFEEHFHNGILGRDVFAKINPAFWPFLLKKLVDSVGTQLSYRQQNDILRWLDEGSCNHLDLSGSLLWLDLDGVGLHPKYQFQSCWFNGCEPIHWGPWVLKIKEELAGAEQKLGLQLAKSKTKTLKETLRHHKVPYRFRSWLPELVLPSETVSLFAALLDDRFGLSIAWGSQPGSSTGPFESLIKALESWTELKLKRLNSGMLAPRLG